MPPSRLQLRTPSLCYLSSGHISLSSSPQKHCVLSRFRPSHMLFPLLRMLFSVPLPVPPPPSSTGFTQFRSLSFSATSKVRPSPSPAEVRSLVVHAFSQHSVVFLHSMLAPNYGFVHCFPPLLEWLKDEFHDGTDPGCLNSHHCHFS